MAKGRFHLLKLNIYIYIYLQNVFIYMYIYIYTNISCCRYQQNGCFGNSFAEHVVSFFSWGGGYGYFVRFKCIRYPAYTRTPEIDPTAWLEFGNWDLGKLTKKIGPTINSGFEWNNRLWILRVFVAFTGIVDDHDSLITIQLHSNLPGTSVQNLPFPGSSLGQVSILVLRT